MIKVSTLPGASRRTKTRVDIITADATVKMTTLRCMALGNVPAFLVESSGWTGWLPNSEAKWGDF